MADVPESDPRYIKTSICDIALVTITVSLERTERAALFSSIFLVTFYQFEMVKLYWDALMGGTA